MRQDMNSFELQWKTDLYLQTLAIKTFFFLQNNIPRKKPTKAANRNKQSTKKNWCLKFRKNGNKRQKQQKSMQFGLQETMTQNKAKKLPKPK